MTKDIDCNKCAHFYITWDKSYPRGCRVMGFKCKEVPSVMVYKASGIECLRFEEKKVVGDR
jgi:hypothetical protein